MQPSLLALLALVGGAHAFASAPEKVAGTTEKGRLSRDSFVFDLDDLDAAASSLCSCNYAGDGECDDGGEGSQHSVCEFGSDGSDCADRGTKGCTVPQCAIAAGVSCNNSAYRVQYTLLIDVRGSKEFAARDCDNEEVVANDLELAETAVVGGVARVELRNRRARHLSLQRRRSS